MKSFSFSLKLVFLLYFLLLIIYAFFSYSLTAPNLILSSWAPYWDFQNFMWETFFNNRELLTQVYLLLILALFINYFLIIKFLKNSKLKINFKKIIFIFALLISPLLFSNNALSYDVFNYMFNAKEILVYGGNPHVQIPLDFPQDDWLRFMHNTHTSAPYGYGWTVLSLIPYAFGFGKFLPTWVLFRLFSFLSIILLFYSLKFLAKKLNFPLTIYHLSLLFLNPLFLIEIISNSHNDLWMLAPAILSLALVIKNFKFKSVILSLLLLIFSISIKLATLAVLPIWIFLVFKNFLPVSAMLKALRAGRIISKNIILLSSVALFIPLFTERSKQFLPWYLLWSLVWIPLLLASKKAKHWVNLLLIFSFTAMLRYLPYMWFGTYGGFVEIWQKMIVWSAVLVCLVAMGINKILLVLKRLK